MAFRSFLICFVKKRLANIKLCSAYMVEKCLAATRRFSTFIAEECLVVWFILLRNAWRSFDVS